MAPAWPDRVPIPKRGSHLRGYGRTLLLVGGVGGITLDGLTWLLTREGNLVRVALGAGVAGFAVFLLALAHVIDRVDESRLRESWGRR